MGLSNAEAKIYLALLELGSSKTGRIIDRTKLQSSTVYHVLGSLVEKGIVSHILQGKVKHYNAEPPEAFLNFLGAKPWWSLDLHPCGERSAHPQFLPDSHRSQNR